GGEAVKKELGADVEYFSARVELGPNGVEKILPLGNLSEYEQGLVKAALPELTTNITNGVSFIAGPKL
ncbi:malate DEHYDROGENASE, NAD-dependent, partial [Tulasnella sp. 408]